MKGADREWYGRELARVLDEIDAKEEAIREELKERRGEVAKLKKRAKELRNIVSGRNGAQLDLTAGDAAAALAAARKGGES